LSDERVSRYEVSCVLPAYNEERCIEKAVTAAMTALRKCAGRFEVVVVDDGSSDGTAEILKTLGARYPELRVIRHPANKGYGAALRTGFLAAKCDLVFFTDSDVQFDMDQIQDLLPLSDSHDIVTGFRIRRNDPLLRFLLSRGYNALVRTFFGFRVRDINCAFKLYRRDLFREISIDSDDYFVAAEIFAKAHVLGRSITETGVNHFPRYAGQTKVRPSAIPQTIRQLLRIRRSVRAMSASRG